MGLSFFAGLPSVVVLATCVALRQSGSPTYITLPLPTQHHCWLYGGHCSAPAIELHGIVWEEQRWIVSLLIVCNFLSLFVHGRRLLTQEPVFTEIEPGLFVAGWPALLGLHGVVDYTCELPRYPCVDDLAYLCVPIWDTSGPRPAEIENAVQSANEREYIYFHCAFGHGRSVMIMCALFIGHSKSETWQNAETYIKRSRAGARLNKDQKKSLIHRTGMLLHIKQEKK